MENEFSRTRRLLGQTAMERLKDSHVMVFGIGGVGSHCIEALARSGVGRLSLVDHDVVSVSNINRQSIAFQSTVGRYKTRVMEEKILDINPRAKVQIYEKFVLPENVSGFFGEKPDFVVDAIDTVSAKVALALLAKEQDISIITGDIKEAAEIFGAASFDVVTSNPPYMTGNHGLVNPRLPKAIARHELLCSLEDVVRATSRVVRPGGRFYLVHRPFRLAEILTLLVQYKLEPKRMRLVYPFVDKEPNMVLIEAVQGGRSRITVEKPLIVYKEPGVYTDEIYDIYGY